MRRRPTSLATAGAAALALVCGAPATAPASSDQISIFEANRELLSTLGEGKRKQTLREIEAFGVTHVRMLVAWKSVVKTNNTKTKPKNLADDADPNARGYDWTAYDALIGDAAARGIEVIPTLTGPVPRWATPGGRDNLTRPDQKAFGRFAQAAGARYRDLVDTWTIWNEPNQPQFLLPQFVKGKPFSPGHYRGLFTQGRAGLVRAGNGGDTILAGETSPRGNENIVAPVTFIKEFFKGKRLDVDGWAHHPYTTAAGPFYRPKKVDITIGVLSRLTKALDRYAKGPKLPVFLTEFGIQSRPDPINGVSQPKQAAFRSISEKIAFDNPRVRGFSQYLMRDDLPRKGADRYGGFESGLRLFNGRKKLAYDAFRLPLVADLKGKRKVALWGLVRPADGAATVTLESRDKGARGWDRVASLRTKANGSFTKSAAYREGREYRVRWKRFAGPPTRAYRSP